MIERLRLVPHPEGGWYRETWRAPSLGGERAVGTAIYFLLEAGQRSHWHRIDGHEIWLWHEGDPLELETAVGKTGPVDRVVLGVDGAYQAIVPASAWQQARPLDGQAGYSLVSCIVAPGFTFDGFELADDDWSPGGA
nr:cupin domain-containing protein [Sphingomicrobium nitratireducens]